MTRQDCNTCGENVPHEGNNCTWKMCPFHPERREEKIINGARVKELKCSKCYTKVPFDDEAIDLAANTCRYRYRKDHQACGMVQWRDFLQGKQSMTLPKQPIPALLESKEKRDPVPITNATCFEIDVPPVIIIHMNKKGHVAVSREE